MSDSEKIYKIKAVICKPLRTKLNNIIDPPASFVGFSGQRAAAANTNSSRGSSASASTFGKNRLSNEEIEELKKEDKCFVYKEPGYMASEHKKGGLRYEKKTIEVKPPVIKEVQQAPEEALRITILKRKENHQKKEQIKTKTQERKKTANEPEEVDICSIGAAPFLINASKKYGGTVFSASIKELDKLLAWYKRNPGEEVTISSINAEADQYNDETLKRLIPE
ncbi:MAG: hypothetical protein L6R38_000061 [Xanthoria sp. 2 TBL-2021]|nr:MAG: hypothetical protein L6R38_000061 [Xanthoria sp. 2 TBL-2021]